jgi:hypothetical protein
MNRHERRAAKKRKSSHPECKMVCEETNSEQGVDLFIVFDGVKIARRGYPDTPQARTWVSLEPGFQVLDGEPLENGGGQIVILRDGVPIQ